jgi:hypothetical protein
MATGEVCPEGWAADGKTGDFLLRRGDKAAGMGDFAGKTGWDGVCSGWIYAAERENGPKRPLGTASSGYMRLERLSPNGGEGVPNAAMWGFETAPAVQEICGSSLALSGDKTMRCMVAMRSMAWWARLKQTHRVCSASMDGRITERAPARKSETGC